jgi:hypothetical protein
MKKCKRNYLKELWWNRPWVYIPDVILFMKKYPFQKGRRFRVWLRNCLCVNWQVCLVEVKNGK